MTTGGLNEGESTVMQYDPQHPELGPLRKRIDYKQGTNYLAMQATTKANEERDAARQQATYEREAALEREKNARFLKDKAAAADDVARQSQVVLQTFGSKHLLANKDYDTMTQAEKNSLKTIADATVKMYEEESKQKVARENRTPVARFAQFIDGEGKPHYVTQETGAAAGWTLAPTGGGGGGAGTAQSQTARLLAAVNEAQAAKDRMFAFEQKWLAGDRTPGTGNQIATSFAMTDAAKHPITQALGETVAQFGGQANADYLQYRRDAQLIARAEQLMSSRGGSEASVASNSLLARAIPGAGYKESIAAARQSREALFGKFGGVAQALTPAQLKKLADGLEASKRGDAEFDYASVGKDVGVTMDAHQTKRTMTAEQYAAARTAGYRDAEIIAQGYKLPPKTPSPRTP
jgi:hypothetical protein